MLLFRLLNRQNSAVSATKIIISSKSVAFKSTQLLKSSVNGNNFRYFKHLCCFFDRLAAEFQRRWQQKNRPGKSGRFFYWAVWRPAYMLFSVLHLFISDAVFLCNVSCIGLRFRITSLNVEGINVILNLHNKTDKPAFSIPLIHLI